MAKLSRKALRGYRDSIAMEIASRIAEKYRFLELADIMEWKRTRVKR